MPFVTDFPERGELVDERGQLRQIKMDPEGKDQTPFVIRFNHYLSSEALTIQVQLVQRVLGNEAVTKPGCMAPKR